jgi:fatty-acyl-CoA synthase
MSMLSYARGPVAPILEKTIGQVLAGIAARFPERDALISRHQNPPVVERV